MSFVTDSYSLSEKLQARGLRLPVLVGLITVGALVIVLLGQQLLGVISGEVFADSGILVEAGETSDDQITQDSSNTSDGQDSKEGSAGDVSDSGKDANAQAASSRSIYVDVVGQVKNPGMYELTEGARLAVAVEMAGGFTKKADRASVNQAQILTDGQQVVVAEKQSEPSSSTSQAKTSSSGASTSSAAGSTGAKVNINTADADALTSLSGIGDVTAQKIIADREANGAFKKPEDIKRVSGIGDKKYEAIADFICV